MDVDVILVRVSSPPPGCSGEAFVCECNDGGILDSTGTTINQCGWRLSLDENKQPTPWVSVNGVKFNGYWECTTKEDYKVYYDPSDSK